MVECSVAWDARILVRITSTRNALIKEVVNVVIYDSRFRVSRDEAVHVVIVVDFSLTHMDTEDMHVTI